MKRALVALTALASVGAMAASAPSPFRVGVLAAASAACAAPGPSAPAGERAYFDLLKKRMDREVEACPVANPAEGAALLAAGKLDITVLDGASYATVRSVARATMTVRRTGGLTRVPAVLAVRDSEAAGGVEALKGRTLAFGGSTPAALNLPRQVLTEQGLGEFHEMVTADEVAALAAVRAHKADAVILQAAAWQRQCRGDSPTAQPCGDLKILWRARPVVDRAFAVRRDMPEPERFRLIGLHVPMHLEDKAAFAWAASQLTTDPADFEAAEADALIPAHLQ